MYESRKRFQETGDPSSCPGSLALWPWGQVTSSLSLGLLTWKWGSFPPIFRSHWNPVRIQVLAFVSNEKLGFYGQGSPTMDVPILCFLVQAPLCFSLNDVIAGSRRVSMVSWAFPSLQRLLKHSNPTAWAPKIKFPPHWISTPEMLRGQGRVHYRKCTC